VEDQSHNAVKRDFFFFNLQPSGRMINEKKRGFEDCPRKCRYVQSSWIKNFSSAAQAGITEK
jgi:hypothetical protein